MSKLRLYSDNIIRAKAYKGSTINKQIKECWILKHMDGTYGIENIRFTKEGIDALVEKERLFYREWIDGKPGINDSRLRYWQDERYVVKCYIIEESLCEILPSE